MLRTLVRSLSLVAILAGSAAAAGDPLPAETVQTTPTAKVAKKKTHKSKSSSKKAARKTHRKTKKTKKAAKA